MWATLTPNGSWMPNIELTNEAPSSAVVLNHDANAVAKAAQTKVLGGMGAVMALAVVGSFALRLFER